ncbi:MAG: hypothetical protein ACXWNI_07410 [Candidatus Limnocylindrales bacterium]
MTPRQAATAVDATPLPEDASPSVGTTGAPPATGAPSATGTPPATADPLDASLSNLDQLLNGIDNSISNSDVGVAGGE